MDEALPQRQSKNDVVGIGGRDFEVRETKKARSKGLLFLGPNSRLENTPRHNANRWRVQSKGEICT